jgi:hypothetical protein
MGVHVVFRNTGPYRMHSCQARVLRGSTMVKRGALQLKGNVELYSYFDWMNCVPAFYLCKHRGPPWYGTYLPGFVRGLGLRLVSGSNSLVKWAVHCYLPGLSVSFVLSVSLVKCSRKQTRGSKVRTGRGSPSRKTGATQHHAVGVRLVASPWVNAMEIRVVRCSVDDVAQRSYATVTRNR